MSRTKIELAGVREIAEEFGVTRTAVSAWARRRGDRPGGFPRPVAVLSMGPVYDMAEVRRWRSKRTQEPVAAG